MNKQQIVDGLHLIYVQLIIAVGGTDVADEAEVAPIQASWYRGLAQDLDKLIDEIQKRP